MSTSTVSPRRRAICSLATSLGLLAIAVSIVLPILSGSFQGSPLYRWIYAGGAAVCLLSALFNPNPYTGLRERRWHRIEAWSAIFFAAAAVFLFIPGAAPREWLALTLAGATLRIIVFVRPLFARRKDN